MTVGAVASAFAAPVLRVDHLVGVTARVYHKQDDAESDEYDPEGQRYEDYGFQGGKRVPSLEAEPVEATLLLRSNLLAHLFVNITMKKNPKVILLGETRTSP